MTPNKEDYLKCIYEIGTEEGKITNKEIANRMEVSPPAVTEMIKKLISEDLIIKDKDKGYLLTETGTINVAELYRKHRLIEVFLADHLQYSCDQIHQEAEILEHTVSDHFINALDRYARQVHKLAYTHFRQVTAHYIPAKTHKDEVAVHYIHCAVFTEPYFLIGFGVTHCDVFQRSFVEPCHILYGHCILRTFAFTEHSYHPIRIFSFSIALKAALSTYTK